MEKYTRNTGCRWQGMQRIVDNVRAADLPRCNECNPREIQPACTAHTCTSYTADTFPLYSTANCACAETACGTPACQQTCHHGQTYRVEGQITLWPEYDASCRHDDSLTWDVRCRRNTCQ